MSKFVAAARVTFKRYPFAVNSIIYGSLYVGAEFSQQYITRRILPDEEDKKPIDYGALSRYAVMGTVVYSPTLYTWYKWLDKFFPGSGPAPIIKKMVVDQFGLTPVLLTVFYTGMSLMEQAEDIFEEWREKFKSTFVKSCYFWIPVQAFNFVVIPSKFRVIYMGVCGFMWVNILCYLKRENIIVVQGATPVALPQIKEDDDELKRRSRWYRWKFWKRWSQSKKKKQDEKKV